ncbi:hypothetical protein AB0I39_07625 [Kitasatospora purpeofusca]|uniref:hypothetical protein n=1 Tax=Kitasatospora purpeofusca TaxID=67352 RepID=UPI0033C6EE07
MNSNTLKDTPATALYAASAGIVKPAAALAQCAAMAQQRGWTIGGQSEFWDCAPPGRLVARSQWAGAMRQAEAGVVAGIVVHRLADVVSDGEAYARLGEWAVDQNTFVLFVDGGSYGALHLVGRAPAGVIA